MSHHRLFLPPEQIDCDRARITGPDHIHLARVLRARPGDTVLLLDNRGNGFRAHIVSIEQAATVASIDGVEPLPAEPVVHITVAQALGKGDKFDQVLQHGVEVGASAFIPLRAERCVADVPVSRLPDRLVRWRQIVRSAAEQSQRPTLPEVEEPIRPPQLMQIVGRFDAFLMLHPAEQGAVRLYDALKPLALPLRLLIAVGPEGGWSEPEIAQARAAAGITVTLGSRVMRTETAALAALSQILYHFDTV